MSFFGKLGRALIGDNTDEERIPIPTDSEPAPTDPTDPTETGEDQTKPTEGDKTDGEPDQGEPKPADGGQSQPDEGEDKTDAGEQPPKNGESDQDPPPSEPDDDEEPQFFSAVVYAALEKVKGKKPRVVRISDARKFRKGLIRVIESYLSEHGVVIDSKNVVVASLADELLASAEKAGLIRLTVAEIDSAGEFQHESDPATKKALLDRYTESIKSAQKADQIEKDLKSLFAQLSEDDLAAAAELSAFTPPKGEELDSKDLAAHVAKMKPSRRNAIINAVKAMTLPSAP